MNPEIYTLNEQVSWNLSKYLVSAEHLQIAKVDNDDDDGAGKKAVKETVPIRLQSDKLKFGSWKPERRSLNNAVHKLRG